MKIALLTIGDELLEGTISNSNAQWPAKNFGLRVYHSKLI